MIGLGIGALLIFAESFISSLLAVPRSTVSVAIALAIGLMVFFLAWARLPRELPMMIGLAVASVIFACISLASTWVAFHDIWPSIVMAGLPWYGALLGIFAFGSTAAIVSLVTRKRP